jgi:hypothetical protein
MNPTEHSCQLPEMTRTPDPGQLEPPLRLCTAGRDLEPAAPPAPHRPPPPAPEGDGNWPAGSERNAAGGAPGPIGDGRRRRPAAAEARRHLPIRDRNRFDAAAAAAAPQSLIRQRGPLESV